MLIRLDTVSLAFGSRPLLDHVELQVDEGERVCVVGRNGEGKSSLLRLVARSQAPDDGAVWVRPGARVAFLVQDLDAVEDAKVIDIVAGGLAHDAGEHWEIGFRVETVLSRLGLDGELRFSSLSGGWRRRALLGRALVAEPDVLLLDEPTNHLDIEAIEWLEQMMLEFRGALLFVSHDRAFVNRLATRVVELDRGQLSSWPGNYDEFEVKKALQLENEAKASALFDKRLAQEEVWIRKGVEARRTRNEGRVRALQAMRREHRDRRERIGQADLNLQEAKASGKLVFEAEKAGVAFGDKVVIRDFSVRVQRGDRIGIVGPNGAGKSTLIRLILGDLEPQSGRVSRGTRLEVAYYDQQREQLDLTRSLVDNIGDGREFVNIGGENRHVVGLPARLPVPAGPVPHPGKCAVGRRAQPAVAGAALHATREPAGARRADQRPRHRHARPARGAGRRVPGHAAAGEPRSRLPRPRGHQPAGARGRRAGAGVRRRLDATGRSIGIRARRRRHARAGSQVATAASPVAGRRVRRQARRRRGGQLVAAAGSGARTEAEELSYKDQRDFESLPAKIEALEAEKAALEAQAGDPAFYSGAQEPVRATLARLEKIGGEIDAAYEHWAALEVLRAG